MPLSSGSVCFRIRSALLTIECQLASGSILISRDSNSTIRRYSASVGGGSGTREVTHFPSGGGNLERCVDVQEAQVDVSGDPNRLFFDHVGPHYVQGIRVTYYIPFSGYS